LACKIPPEGDDKWFMCLKGYSYWAPVKVLCMVRIFLRIKSLFELYRLICVVFTLVT